MYNILLICSAGMSTSLLVTKIEKEAEARGIEAHVWAVSDAQAINNVDQADVVLLGPQVRFLRKKVEGMCPGKPVDVIDMRSYGMMDGAAALDQALKLLGQA